MGKKLRPIIKWTGGKFDEFALFSDQIPEFERYIEPFFGGGGVFFALQPQVKSYINDKSTDLINFYKQVGQKKFKIELLNFANAWDELTLISKLLWVTIAANYNDYINGKIEKIEFTAILEDHLSSVFGQAAILNDQKFITDSILFKNMLLASMADKARRIKRICEKENRIFSFDELFDHFETGIKGGFYLFTRTLLNLNYHKILALEPAKIAAVWYFVREFCYGSMFRFNAKGEFNIPYGGIAYNKKNFRLKVENIFESGITKLFKQTEIYNLDFEHFLKQITIQTTDFIFLDPPYDSEFSEYDQSAFSQNDQQRLATFLLQTTAKWMVVIKETAFIRNLYTHPLVNIRTFDKNYTYNVRGRNNRGVTHLIITNY